MKCAWVRLEVAVIEVGRLALRAVAPCSSESPATIGGSPVMLSLYVPDVDATVQRALEAAVVGLGRHHEGSRG